MSDKGIKGDHCKKSFRSIQVQQTINVNLINWWKFVKKKFIQVRKAPYLFSSEFWKFKVFYCFKELKKM